MGVIRLRVPAAVKPRADSVELPMKIAIIGAGNVGGTLGQRWAESDHQVTYGTPHPDSDDTVALVDKTPDGQAKTTPEAVEDAEVVVFAVPWTALESAAKEAGDLGGKVVIDCTNPIAADFSGLDPAIAPSGAEHLARWMPGTRIVKAFNTVGFNIMASPEFGDHGASMLICGDDVQAKEVVKGLAEDIGFEPEDAGPLSMAGYLEHLAWLWIAMALKYGHGREMAFHLDKR